MVKFLLMLLRWVGVDVVAERKRALRQYQWLSKRVEEVSEVSVPKDVQEMAENLLPWIHKFEDVPQGAGWKRKEVYALGVKTYPDTPKNIVAYALEYAIWKDSQWQ